jgi:hypothetical protein
MERHGQSASALGRIVSPRPGVPLPATLVRTPVPASHRSTL